MNVFKIFMQIKTALHQHSCIIFAENIGNLLPKYLLFIFNVSTNRKGQYKSQEHQI